MCGHVKLVPHIINIWNIFKWKKKKHFLGSECITFPRLEKLALSKIGVLTVIGLDTQWSVPLLLLQSRSGTFALARFPVE